MSQKERVLQIAKEAILENIPDAAVRRAMKDVQSSPCQGKTILIAIGKAGWEMAKSASDALERKFDEGFLITKYGHIKGELPGFQMFEAGHPLLDQNAIDATKLVLNAVSNLSDDDRVLLLLSGGGSSLFESPLIPLDELVSLSGQMLACGASIVEINTVRKRLSSVKGGKFALLCAPATVYSVILSDVLGDRPDMIASGPAYPDQSTSCEAFDILKKYGVKTSDAVLELLSREPVKKLDNISALVTGGVSQLCLCAKRACERAGYEAHVLTDSMSCEARDAGSLLGGIARYQSNLGKKLALIAGGETIVHVKGNGLGGRNQEMALAAAREIAGCANVVIACIGSDGTDGPTDAAGGVVDGETQSTLKALGISISAALDENDAYHALEKCGGLIKTGSTGTNVNDVAIILIEGD